ncbi:hypothetical protein CC80DRAFT_530608 [Byssothecium circinans]|uniref:RRM domain-containing protein n=1 Tax=Byssothecium circinans TaxID=147558 RepID=A0A6A5UCH3_9PLEO|nr:hypothetical protein CC80DRAFT_530608 [Byssothecium circinans]
MPRKGKGKGVKLDIGDYTTPEQRVLRLTNVHYDTSDDEVRELFKNYTVVDVRRDINTASGKNTVAYVLLETLHEVIHAQAELEMAELRGRDVRISRAKSGFEIDDGLLKKSLREQDPEPQLEPEPEFDRDFFDANPELEDVQEPAMSYAEELDQGTHEELTSDLQIGPGPTPVAPWAGFVPDSVLLPEPASSAPIEASSSSPVVQSTPLNRPRRVGSDDAPPYDRVLLMTNLHTHVLLNDVRLFFRGYNVIDFKRSLQPNTGQILTMGFVLFGSLQQRIDAKLKLNGCLLFGRHVILQPARGIKVWETGFSRPEEASVMCIGFTNFSSNVRSESRSGHSESRGSINESEPSMDLPPLHARRRLVFYGHSSLPTWDPYQVALTGDERLEAPASEYQESPPLTIQPPHQMVELEEDSPQLTARPIQPPQGIPPLTASPVPHPEDSPPLTAKPIILAHDSPLLTAVPVPEAQDNIRCHTNAPISPSAGTRAPTADPPAVPPGLDEASWPPPNPAHDILAHQVLRPWNLAGNDDTSRRFNMVTEREWFWHRIHRSKRRPSSDTRDAVKVTKEIRVHCDQQQAYNSQFNTFQRMQEALLEEYLKSHTVLCQALVSLMFDKLPKELRDMIFDVLLDELPSNFDILKIRHAHHTSDWPVHINMSYLSQCCHPDEVTFFGLLPHFLTETCVGERFLHEFYSNMYYQTQFRMECNHDEPTQPLRKFLGNGPFTQPIALSPAKFLRRLTVSLTFPDSADEYLDSSLIRLIGCKTASTLLPLASIARTEGFKLEILAYCRTAMAYLMVCPAIRPSIAQLEDIGFVVDLQRAEDYDVHCARFRENSMWMWVFEDWMTDSGLKFDKEVWDTVTKVWSASGFKPVEYTG